MAARLPVIKTTEAGSAPSAARTVKTTLNATYWIDWPDGRGLVKHGETTRGVRARKAEHDASLARCGGLPPGFLVGASCGDRSSQDAALSYFAEERLPGTELLRLSQRLERYLRWYRKQDFVSVEQDVVEVCAGITWDRVAPGVGREVLPPWEVERVFPYPVDSLFAGGSLVLRDLPPIQSAPWSTAGRREFWGVPVLTGDDYYTPKEDVERIRAFLGEIDLDPASHRVANAVIKAKEFFELYEDGLTLPWYGKVLLNPPFSGWAEWGKKLLSERRSGRADEVVAIAHSGMITNEYMAGVMKAADAICIRTGRMKFWGKKVDDGNGAGPNDGQVLLYFGQRTARYTEFFDGEYGTVRK